MAWYTWVIIGLVILSYVQYAYPEKSHEWLEPAHGKAKDFISGAFNGGRSSSSSSSTTTASPCPDVDNPVCGDDGVTYRNACEAAQAGIMKTVYGACVV